MAQKGFQELSCAILPLRAALFWAHHGPSWTILGPLRPFLEGPRGYLEADLGGRTLAMEVSNGEVGGQLGCEHDPRGAQEGPRGAKMARKGLPNI